MKVNKLRGKIVEQGMNIEKLAAAIGVERSSLYRKLANSDKITIGEAVLIKRALNLSDEDACDIFLT